MAVSPAAVAAAEGPLPAAAAISWLAVAASLREPAEVDDSSWLGFRVYGLLSVEYREHLAWVSAYSPARNPQWRSVTSLAAFCHL